jgi:uncharacterized protein YndB with AHSA1/START domain
MSVTKIERDLRIEATPEVVYEVISSAEHLREWWPDDAAFDAVVGSTGHVTFGDPTSPDAKTERLTVVEADAPHRFAFLWVYGAEDAAQEALLVTFDLSPCEEGTLLRFSESGFDEREWDAATAVQARADHEQGWDTFLPRLATYAGSLAPRP